jgi:hypothetical protein
MSSARAILSIVSMNPIGDIDVLTDFFFAAGPRACASHGLRALAKGSGDQIAPEQGECLDLSQLS